MSREVWISPRDLDAPGVRLFCLPHAGSGAAGFYRWKRLLPASIAVCPVLLPGREARLGRPALTDWVSIVDELAAQVGPHVDRPYAIFGHSMGALLAYEWARRAVPAPLCLFASGRKAPQMETSHRGLHRLPEDQFVRELKRRYGGEPEALLADPELRDVFLPILRSDLQVVESYDWEPGPGLAFEVCAMAGLEDRSVSDEGLARWGELIDVSSPQTYGSSDQIIEILRSAQDDDFHGGAVHPWGTHSSAGFVSCRFAGDHFYHFGAGQVELLRFIAETMERLSSEAR